MAKSVGLWLAAVLCAGGALAQKPGAVEGAITNSVTAAPVRKALVTLHHLSRNEGYQALSDAAGHFRFDNVKPGEYGLWAEANGYAREPNRFDKPAVTVAEDKTAGGCSIRLLPLGAISGRVLDENGGPAVNARVSALTYSYQASGRFPSNHVEAITNDRGEYRLFDIPGGRWYLQVEKKLPRAEATGRVHHTEVEAEYADTYYPGVTREEDAGAIEMTPGAEITQIEIRIRKARVYHLRGKVIDGRSGRPVATAELTIENVGNVPSHEEGLFDARGMAPGVYRMAAAAQADVWLFSAVRDVSITDHDVNDLVFRLEPGLTLQGTATTENAQADALKNLRVALEPVDGMFHTGSVPVYEDGTFRFPNVAAHQYRVMIEGQPPGLYLKSVRTGSQEATDDLRVDIAPGVPLTLVFAGDVGRLEGAVPAGGPPAVTVALAPAGRLRERRDLVKTVTGYSASGQFKIEGIAPGEYKLFAWELDDVLLAQYDGFRKLVESKATAVTIHAGETQSVQVKAIPAAEVQEARRKLR